MAITSVGGFFGKRNRQRKPAGVEVVFATDESGSMGPLVGFINEQDTIVNLENALIAENVGLLVPNRYCRSSMQNMYQVGAPGSQVPWQFGSDILADPLIWDDWTPSGFRWGASQEDVTGAAFRIVNTQYPYGFDLTNNATTNGSVFGPTYPTRTFRDSASRIIISGSDEQNGDVQYHSTQVYGALIDPRSGARYIAISSVRIITDVTTGGPDVDVQPFGIVFTSPTVWKLILRPVSITDTDPIFVDVDSNSISFSANGAFISDTTASGPTILPVPANSQQFVNTPKLARGSGGAVYDIAQFNQPNGPAVFGKSLGLVLGRFLYSLE